MFIAGPRTPGARGHSRDLGRTLKATPLPPLSLLCPYIWLHAALLQAHRRLVWFTNTVLEKAAERMNTVICVAGPEWLCEPHLSVHPQAMGPCDMREASRGLRSGVALCRVWGDPRRPGALLSLGVPMLQLWHLQNGVSWLPHCESQNRGWQRGLASCIPVACAPVGKLRPEHQGDVGRDKNLGHLSPLRFWIPPTTLCQETWL